MGGFSRGHDQISKFGVPDFSLLGQPKWGIDTSDVVHPKTPMSASLTAVVPQLPVLEPRAFAALFENYEQTLFRFVYRRVPCASDVEDIVQATFVRALRGCSSFDGRSTILTWLLGIAANVVRHHVRSKVRRQRLERYLEIASQNSNETRVAEIIEAKYSLAAANDALQKLDAEKQEAFVMCEIEGLSAREVAETLGATETTVWKRVSDTRKILKRAVLEQASL
jgi:RNA polymerase sigma-70 factor (ECF subfamily)